MKNNTNNSRDIIWSEYIIIGSGISGLSASNQLNKRGIDHIILSSPKQLSNKKESKKFKNKKRFLLNKFLYIFKLNKDSTPKLNIRSLRYEINSWIAKYGIKLQNFNLIQVLGTKKGGLTNYWGANLGHDINIIKKSEIRTFFDVNKASKLINKNGEKIHSKLSENLLNLSTANSDETNIKVFSPFLALSKKDIDLAICERCQAYYCNCSGSSLQKKIINKTNIYDIHVEKIHKLEDYFLICGLDNKNLEINFKCKFIIFGSGPLASAYLLNTFFPIKNKLEILHNPIFSFPFFSLYPLSNNPLGLSNLNISIFPKKRFLLDKFPNSYANIFPLKPQLLVRFPFFRFIPNIILNRLYIAVIFSDSKFVASIFNLQNKTITGKYKSSYFKHACKTFLNLSFYLLKFGKALPLLPPLISKPGNDIHYGGTLSKIKFPEELKRKLFFVDPSKAKRITSVNPTVINLSRNIKKLNIWLDSK